MINAKVLIDAVRSLLFFIDSIVYSFIPMLYRLILYLANVDLFTDNIPVQGLIRRIYIIVGVFMLFRLSFSIMNYIVNPDAFSDQSKGFSNMVKRTVIAVVLLVCIPWFFGEAYMLQGKILTSGVLQKFILGETGETSDNLEKTIEISAKDLQFLLFSPFFHLNYNSGSTEVADSSGDLSECKPTESAPSTHILGSSDMANSDCFDTVAELMDDDPSVESSGVTLYSFFRFEDDNGEVQDYRKFDSFGGLVSWSLSDGEYAIKYRAIFSTIFGGYLVFLLLSFCIDVAARAIRLLFLQILSPVAVISSVDPTSSGDRLKEWAKECLKVWVSLFLRLAVIFLVIQLVRIITNSVYSGEVFFENSGIKLSGNGDIIFWVFIFLILGVFQAANKIPDLIEKASGIKMSGELQLNPFKALSSNAGFNFLSGAALGAAGGGLSGAFAAFNTARTNEHGVLRSIGSGLGALGTGGVTGLFRGGRAGGVKGWNSGLQSGGRIARRMDVRESTGGWKGVPGMIVDRARDIVGASTSYESMENRAKRFDEVGENIDGMQQRIVDQLSKKNNHYKELQAQKMQYDQALRGNSIVDASKYMYDENGQLRDDFNDIRASQIKRGNAEFQQLSDEFYKAVDSGDDKRARELTELMEQKKAEVENYVNGQLRMDDELSVFLNNQIYDEEQKMIGEYYDNNIVTDSSGNITYKDEQLELRRRAAEKAAKDAGFGDTLPGSWKDIGGSGNPNSLKSNSEHKAVKIRSSKEYNDARDRDKAIHSTRLDSHQKR